MSALSTDRPGRRVNLCFHGVGSPGRDLEDGEDAMWVGVDGFAEIVEAAHEHPREVLFTFDDGNESDFTQALPVLQRFDERGEFFVIAGRIDTPGSLSSEQVHGLSEAGQRVGTHGMQHKRWREVSAPDEVEAELVGAADLIAGTTGRPVTHAACPNGSYDRRVLRLLKARYSTVYTVDGGSASPTAWLQSRHTVLVDDTAASITALLDRPDGSTAERLTRSAKQLVKRWR